MSIFLYISLAFILIFIGLDMVNIIKAIDKIEESSQRIARQLELLNTTINLLLQKENGNE